LGDIIGYALLGIAGGGAYGLMALGIVVIYRGSGVINFAQGAVGAVGTYAYWDLSYNYNVPWPVALIAGLGVCGVIGLLLQLLVMRPLRDASPLSRMVATFGVLAILQTALQLSFPVAMQSVVSFLPSGAVRFDGITLGYNRILIFGIAVALGAVLWAGSTHTRFGFATTAVAENPRAASALGFSPDTIAASSWIVGSILAGLAGILLTPISGLQITTLTLLVVPALAGALVGAMSSIPITLAACLAISVIQSVVVLKVTVQGWDGLVPFAVIIIVMSLRGRSLPLRGEGSARLPRVGTGRIRPVHVLVWGILAAILIEFVFPPAYADSVTVLLTTAMVLLSLVVIVGYTGQVSLCQMGLAGVGAFTAGRLVAAASLPFFLAAVLGIVAAVMAGLIIGIPALRTRGVNLAIITLCFGVSLSSVLFDNPSYDGGDLGDTIRPPSLFGLSFNDITDPARYALLCLVVFILLAMLVANLRRGRVGLRLIAVRGNERASAALGINVFSNKLYAFALSSALAAVGGILMVFRFPIVLYTGSFTYADSTTSLLYGVIGGIGYVMSSVVGALAEPATPITQYISDLVNGQTTTLWITLIGGVVVLGVLFVAPDGLVRANIEHGRQLVAAACSLAGRVRPRSGTAELAAVQADADFRSVEAVAPRRLEVRGLTVRLGGVVAVNDVSLTLVPGRITGLIGPNGAGKTTLLDAISGFVKPSDGSILLDGSPVDRWSVARRARAGLGRSFQALELFDGLTVFDNLRCAADTQDPWAFVVDLVWPRPPGLSPPALLAISEFQLADTLASSPTDLPYGRRRLISIARAVAKKPSILMLDEPAGGLDDADRSEIGRTIRQLASRWRMAILLVEHNMDLVMDVCDEVVVLDSGSMIASGRPDRIRADAAVRRAYLGDLEDEVAYRGEDAILPAEQPGGMMADGQA